MNEFLYCKMKCEKAGHEIMNVFLYLFLGTFCGILFINFMESLGGDTSSYRDKIINILLVTPIPYGVRKTWKSLFVLRSGGPEQWFLWIFYLVIKLVIALFYGIFGLTIGLIGNIIVFIIYKNKMKSLEKKQQIYLYSNNQSMPTNGINTNQYWQ